MTAQRQSGVEPPHSKRETADPSLPFALLRVNARDDKQKRHGRKGEMATGLWAGAGKDTPGKCALVGSAEAHTI
jgi:hypothetical protein